MKYLLGFCLLLGACVPANETPMKLTSGNYPDYHAVVADLVATRIKGQVAPEGLAERLEQCWADDTVAAIDPYDLNMLDSFARGERPLAESELDRINNKANAKRPGRTQESFDRLSATCPQDIPEFKKYFTLK